MEGTDVDDISALIERSPYHLNFFSEGISLGRAIGGSVLCAHIAKTPRLQYLELRGSSLGHYGCLQLARSLEGHPSLTHLGLARNGIDTPALQELLSALHLAPLRHLDLEWNGIDNTGATAVAALLSSPDCELRTLTFERNDIYMSGCIALAHALQTNRSLRNLNLAFNKVGNAGASALAAMLRINTTLLTLNLNTNDINLDGARSLVDALCANTTLISLNLQGNHCMLAFAEQRETFSLSDAFEELNLQGDPIAATSVGDDIGHVLQRLRKLRGLSLANTAAGDSAFAPVLTGISFMTSLAVLDISSAGIGPICFPLLSDVLRLCASLHTLLVDGNRLEAEGTRHLALGLTRCSSLTSLSLNGCHVGDGVRHLAAAIEARGHPSAPLRMLYLAANDIDSDAVQLLVRALTLPDQNGLMDLNLGRNRLSSRAVSSLCTLLKHHRNLFTISVRENLLADQIGANYADLDILVRYLADNDDDDSAPPAAASSPTLPRTLPTPSTSAGKTPSPPRASAALIPRTATSPEPTSLAELSAAPKQRIPAAASLLVPIDSPTATGRVVSVRGMSDVVPVSIFDRRVPLHDVEGNIGDLCISENQLRLKFGLWIASVAGSDGLHLAVSEFVQRYVNEMVIVIPGEVKRITQLAKHYADRSVGAPPDHLDFAAFAVLMLRLARL